MTPQGKRGRGTSNLRGVGAGCGVVRIVAKGRVSVAVGAGGASVLCVVVRIVSKRCVSVTADADVAVAVAWDVGRAEEQGDFERAGAPGDVVRALVRASEASGGAAERPLAPATWRWWSTVAHGEAYNPAAAECGRSSL